MLKKGNIQTDERKLASNVAHLQFKWIITTPRPIPASRGSKLKETFTSPYDNIWSRAGLYILSVGRIFSPYGN